MKFQAQSNKQDQIRERKRERAYEGGNKSNPNSSTTQGRKLCTLIELRLNDGAKAKKQKQWKDLMQERKSIYFTLAGRLDTFSMLALSFSLSIACVLVCVVIYPFIQPEHVKTITRIWYTRSHGLAPKPTRSKSSKHRALLFASCLAVFRYPIWIELCFYNTGSFPTSSWAAFLFRKYLKQKLFLRLHPLMEVWGSGIFPDKHWSCLSLSRRLFGFNIQCAVGRSLMNWLC